MYQISDKIRLLREQNHMTQSALAKKLGLSRSAVNAWEMSLSDPSLSNLLEMCRIFHVSADYLLGISDRMMLDITDLGGEEREALIRLSLCLAKNKK